MKKVIENLIVSALSEMGLEPAEFVVEHPSDLAFGDYSANIAMVLAKKLGKNPKDLAEEIKKNLESKKDEAIDRIEVAGAGFINFYLSTKFFQDTIGEIIEMSREFGKSDRLRGQKVMIEHTDPNPFKEFHIGHLMPNVIGTALSNIIEWNGAEVKQACYQGDKGVHVACAVWSLQKSGLKTFNSKELGAAYAEGAQAYKNDPDIKKEIDDLNKVIYEESDSSVNDVYQEGKRVSLEYFESIYKRLGTKFDFYFFESETAEAGKQLVEDNLGKIFEESDGAVVFKAEKYNPALHTRVFINSKGIPTYEAKDLGNAKKKFEAYNYTKSIIVTGNEINDYFKVVLESMRQVLPNLANVTEHISHGMLRLPTGKMSSRTGEVITAEWLIEEVKKAINDKGNDATDDIAVASIKYMILRQAIGGDIVFDFDKSISTEGDSGPYLQYAYARTSSLLEKAREQGLNPSSKDITVGRETHEVEKLLYRFPEVVERAAVEYAPHYITTYLTELSGSYNNFYAKERVISEESETAYRLAITSAFNTVMKNGLMLLGISAPEKM
jgi:arginyl-tRNA synthetase